MVSRLRLGADDVAELSQRLRVELVVGGEARGPKLLSYGGRGPLGGFLRAVAMRTALSDLRRVVPKTEAFDGEIMGFATTHDDALENLSARHTQDLGAALRAAVGALSPRDRNVLRLYVLDGASIEVIGRLYGVHRATIARWVGEIRVRIARDAKARMLPLVSASEVTSIARLCYSQLDLSLDRLL